MSWLKWLLLAMVGIVLTVAIILALIPLDQLKPQIEQAVYQATGRRLRLDGEIQLSWFPSIGLKLGATRFGNAPGFGRTPFAELDQAVLRVALTPLLFGQIEAKTLDIDGLRLNLEIDSHGKTNWQDLISQSPSSTPSKEQTLQSLALAISGINIKNAVLTWRDRSSDSVLTIAPLNLSAGAIEIGKPVDLQLGFDLQNTAPNLEAQIKLSARSRLDLTQETVELQDLKLAIAKLSGDDLPIAEMGGQIKGNVLVNLKKHNIELKSLQGTLTGSIAASQQLELKLAANGSMDLKAKRYQFNNLNAALTAKGTPLGKNGLLAKLQTSVMANQSAQTITLAPLKLNISGQPQQEIEADLTMSGQGEINFSRQQIQVSGVKLNFDLRGDYLGTKRLNGILESNFAGDLSSQSFTLSPFNVTLFGELQKEMKSELRLTGKGRYDLTQQSVAIEDVVLNLVAKGKTLAEKEIKGVLTTALHADLTKQTLRVEPIELETMGMQLEGFVRVSQFIEAPAVKGAIKLKPFSPREALASFGRPIPSTIPREILQAFAASADFEASHQGLVLPRILIALDQTKIIGKLSVEDFDKPKIVALIHIDAIDIDRYIALAGNEAEGVTAVQPALLSTNGDDVIALPIETLRDLNLKGMIEIDALKVSGMRMTKLRTLLDSADGLMQIKPFSLAMYEGRLIGGVKVDVRKTEPHVFATINASRIKLGELLKDALGEKSANVEGTTALKLDLSTYGDQISTLKRQLEGSVELMIVQGKLRDRKFAEKLESLIAVLQARRPRHPDDTVLFSLLSATWAPKQGSLHNKDLRLHTELINFRGEGRIDLLQEVVDYSLFPVVSGKERDVLLAPITVKGPINNLHYGLDVTRFSRNRLKNSASSLSEGLQTQIERLHTGVKETAEGVRQKLHEGLETIKKTFELPQRSN